MDARRIASSLIHRTVVPLVPAGKRLAMLAWSNRSLEGGEAELRQLERIVPTGCRAAVDAGANIGLYSLRLARLARVVHAFEINREVTEHLERASLSNVRLVHIGLSDSERRVTLYVPVLEGRSQPFRLHGWASLTPGNCPEARVELELPGKVRTLDSFALDDVDFVKIDVEGHELQVLHGARETLHQCRPRILVEVRSFAPVAAFLAQLGYRARRPEEFGVAGSAPWMHVFEAA